MDNQIPETDPPVSVDETLQAYAYWLARMRANPVMTQRDIDLIQSRLTELTKAMYQMHPQTTDPSQIMEHRKAFFTEMSETGMFVVDHDLMEEIATHELKVVKMMRQSKS